MIFLYHRTISMGSSKLIQNEIRINPNLQRTIFRSDSVLLIKSLEDFIIMPRYNKRHESSLLKDINFNEYRHYLDQC